MNNLLFGDLTKKIIGLAMKVHRDLGPGFVEKVYQRALYLEFKNNKLNFARERDVEIIYNKAKLGYFTADFIVDNKVILELKATDHIGNIHMMQIISYMKAAELKVGLIINFANKSLEWKRIAL